MNGINDEVVLFLPSRQTHKNTKWQAEQRLSLCPVKIPILCLDIASHIIIVSKYAHVVVCTGSDY